MIFKTKKELLTLLPMVLRTMNAKEIVLDFQNGETADMVLINKIFESEFLESFEYSDKRFCTIDGILYSADKKTLKRCPKGRTGKVIIPDGVKKIEYGAFQYCQISSVKMPNSLRCIKGNAFSTCCNLKTVDFGNGLKEIGDVYSGYIFLLCENLKHLKLPKQIRYIAPNTFYDSGLESIELSKSIEGIGPEAFRYSNVTKVKLNNHISESVLSSGLFAQTVVPEDEDSTVIEICLPDDTIYIPKYISEIDMDILCDYIKEAANPVPLIMSYTYDTGIANPDALNDIAVKRYLYLLDNKKEEQMEKVLIKRIQSDFSQILQFLLLNNRESDLQKLILSDIVTNDVLYYALNQLNDTTCRAYILETLKSQKNEIFVL